MEERGHAGVTGAGDAARLVLGVLVLALGGLLAVGSEVGPFEQQLFRAVNRLSAGLAAPMVAVMQLGALLAVPAVAAVAWMGGRRRLTADVLGAGTLGWLLANLVLKPLTGRARPAALIADAVVRGGTQGGPGFPSGHATVAATLATVTAPHLPRGVRWLVWAAAAVVALARVYVGVHLPGDVVGGLGLGVAVGSTWRLLTRREQGAAPP